MTAYYGSIETRTDPSSYYWDGMKRLGHNDAPFFAFQLTLAGWGHFQLHGQPPRRVLPGTAFIALIPSRHRYYLPQESPGWTFGWVSIYHPYLIARMAKQVGATGPVIELAPDGQLTAIALRLIRGAIKKDSPRPLRGRAGHVRVPARVRTARATNARPPRRRQAFAGTVRSRVTADLTKDHSVAALAAEYGMSRTHFSHFFRSRTGVTPARFVAEVRIHHATRMLLDPRTPLKQVALDCGFANANYFSKVFRRFQHMSPAAYRRTLG